MSLKQRSLAVAFGLAFATCAIAQEDRSGLPDIGSSAGELLSPAQEALYGDMTLRELRHYGLLLEDPLVESYLQNLGYTLVARSDRPKLPFTFFMMRSRDINAFATLGGYVGMNAGLVLTADREDEVAAVLAHEISHVTQRHVLRGAERSQKDSLPIALAMLGAVLAAQQAGGDGDATQAAIVGGMAMMQQRQINYTRSNEHEADRLGIGTLARAGFDPLAMAGFFARMERALRGNQGGWQAPEYLRTHPVSTTRISEAKDRATRLLREGGSGSACVMTPGGEVAECSQTRLDPIVPPDVGSLNPLLPFAIAADLGKSARADTPLFDFARERLRVLSAESPGAAESEYQQLRKADPAGFKDAESYGLALALSRGGKTAAADELLVEISSRRPGLYWIDLARAENDHRAGHRALAEDRFERLLAQMPRNRPVILSFAQSLSEYGTPDAGRRAQDVLRPLLASSSHDAAFQQGFARASEIAGDIVRAGEAYAETAYLGGRPEDALSQLERLKKRDDLDYYQRSRIDARIAEITPTVLEFRERGLRPGDRGDQLQDAARPSFTVTTGRGAEAQP